MRIRLDADWMQLLDERILERLAGEGEGTAWMIAFDLNRNRGRVAERCRVLAHAGFVDRIPRAHVDDKWVITDWGRLYLDGEIDADLRRPSPSPRPPDKVRPGWYAGFV